MGAQLFDAVRDLQQLGFGYTVGGDKVGDLGRALGDGAGFVERDDLRFARCFQRLGILEQDARLCAHAISNHDRHGGCQT